MPAWPIKKNHMAVYMSAIYGSQPLRAKFEADYAATGKRYDCGKSCVRFRKLDELPLEVVGDAIASISVESFIAVAKAARQI